MYVGHSNGRRREGQTGARKAGSDHPSGYGSDATMVKRIVPMRLISLTCSPV
jgi:hypothetical protein